MSIAIVVFNASNIAAPDQQVNYESVKEYVENIQMISSLLDSGLIEACCGKSTNETLAKIEQIPTYETVQEMLKSTGYTYVSVKDLILIAYRILGLIDVEKYYGINRLVASSTKCKVMNDLCRDTELRNHMNRILEVLLVLSRREKCSEHIFAFQREVCVKDALVSSRISILEHCISNLRFSPSPTEIVRGYVRFTNSLDGMIMNLNCADIIGNCKGPKELDMVIRAAIFQYREKTGKAASWEECLKVRNYAVRNELYKIVVKGRPDKSFNDKAIRAIIEAIEEEEVRDFHELRINDSKGSPQITRRDGAKAYRRIVDKEVRLHYWKTEDGLKELVRITTKHDDFYIPE